ncbi:Exo-1,4-beta-xylosidase xlnD precursor [Actinidia chinensis var. chinensis]|uniref:Exo-1,4-beta-xylosidase xlnD n=1 Tax=Actinidia chinensis var. chinensis TaxID=1590841 RepID=A0A2R6PHY9_ACTCC|nr:Exo-1,4-beta-xylosidase xlnD precursor [Actinidia chinensis var. chinensis]
MYRIQMGHIVMDFFKILLYFGCKVLKNGAEVKLQRNALSVVEPPTGNEENGDFDNSSSDSDIGHKYNDISSGKLSKRRVRYAKPLVPSASAKTINCSSFKEVQTNVQATQPGTPSPNLTKEQLANAAQQHFCLQQVDEFQVITEFIRAAKRLKAADRNRE